MVKFYVRRVILGKKKWTEVPNLWKEEVVAELESEGYTLNDDGTISK